MTSEPSCKKTILAVDDARQNLAIIKSLLVPDYTVKAATSGALALQIAQSQPPDLILLDITMPDMDGYEICRRLKDAPTTRDIPVIFVTARDQSDDEAHGLALGAVDYITKPIKPAILRARIHTHIALAEASRQLAIQNKALIEAARLRDDVEHITRHDLKSPLNAIIGLPQILLMQCDFTEQQRGFLSVIMESGYRMLDMINRSLDIYKMEIGTYEFRPERINVYAVMRGALAELATAITAKRLRVDIRIDDPDADARQWVEAMAEPLLCHSMLSNLCRNAIEASPPGDVITIGFTCRPEVVIAIENGGAVPETIRERFFEKCVTAGKKGGTGLGTYSAMLIARTQNGAITLDTTIPGRTRLRVTLPAGHAEADAC